MEGSCSPPSAQRRRGRPPDTEDATAYVSVAKQAKQLNITLKFTFTLTQSQFRVRVKFLEIKYR